MITHKQRHSNKFNKKNSSDKHLINIDYLIINLEGNVFGDFIENSNFHSVHYDYGTKIFSNRSDIFYKNEKIGTLTSSPRSDILSKDFAQMQFENHLYYTKTLLELKQLVDEFCTETNYTFKAINRLDICIDKQDKAHTYRNLYNNIVQGSFLISGRPKNISSYYETFKGKSVLNGFQVGKRSSDKIIRVYNKTLSLQIVEKPFINEYFNVNNLKNDNVWRFEYQINSAFFRNLLKVSPENESVTEQMTWGIFSIATLTELLKLANKGFFEIHENTGKSQINKEKKIQIFDFDLMRQSLTNQTTKISRLKKSMDSTTTIKKRLAKSLFREYYANQQDISYVIALNLLLEDNDITTEKQLKYWFRNKRNFYLKEFRDKEKIIQKFDNNLFLEHQQLFL